jgi:uncharacterized membrane protein YeiH
MTIDFIQVVEIFGTATFAISGASMAIQKKLDVFGVLIIAFATSIGGGTLRDVLIGNTPVEWLRNERMITVIFVSAIATLFYRSAIQHLSKTLFLFDSLGLGLFTIVGLEKGLEMDFSPGICIALGTITACFGGVIRDVLLNNVPVIFRKEIYASACIVGGSLYFLLKTLHVESHLAQIICMLVIVFIRVLVVRYQLTLPSFHLKKDKHET